MQKKYEIETNEIHREKKDRNEGQRPSKISVISVF